MHWWCSRVARQPVWWYQCSASNDREEVSERQNISEPLFEFLYFLPLYLLLHYYFSWYQWMKVFVLELWSNLMLFLPLLRQVGGNVELSWCWRFRIAGQSTGSHGTKNWYNTRSSNVKPTKLAMNLTSLLNFFVHNSLFFPLFPYATDLCTFHTSTDPMYLQHFTYFPNPFSINNSDFQLSILYTYL